MYCTKTVFVGASVVLGCWAVILATPASQDVASSAAQQAFRNRNAPQNTCSGATQTCSANTSSQEATFVNPNYPSPQSTNDGVCTLTVTARSGVCQLRLDLTEFSLAQPNNDGVCDIDYLAVMGGSSSVPVICGDNDGQHLYVDVTPGSNVDLDVVTRSVNEKWNIKVTQIPCNSADRAPSGCLQYFTETAGTITSFNYDSSSSAVTRQLADQQYGVCIQSQPGYCSVTYSPEDENNPYSLSGEDSPGLFSPSIIAPPTVGDVDCVNDYLLIPGGMITNGASFNPPLDATIADRFCGVAFPTVTSRTSPFNLYVFTNEGEAADGDVSNQGFQISYRMSVC